MDSLLQDLRYAWRGLRHRPSLTAVAVLTFGLGIGLNVAVFSVVDRVLVRPLPYFEPDRLVVMRQCAIKGECWVAFPSMLVYDARRLTTIESLAVAAMPMGSFALSADPDGPSAKLSAVSATLLRVLGVKPVLGRDFTEEDASRKRAVALIGYESWQSKFGGSPDIVGREIGSRRRVSIVGVLPEGFIPPTWAAPVPDWDGLILDTEEWAAIERTPGLVVGPIARLRPGVTLDQVRADVAGLAGAVASELRPSDFTPANVRVDWLQSSLFGGKLRTNFWLLLGATGLLLLLACANLATLLLSYRRSRDRDAAMAVALGAARTRLVRHALIESMLVCVLGSALAIAILVMVSGALRSVLPPLLARYATGVTDARILLAVLSAATLCSVLAGVAPSLRAARVDLLTVLQRVSSSGRRSRTTGSSTLLAVETALGMVLVLSALLILRTFNRLSNDDVGFEPRGLYAIDASPAAPRRGDGAYYEQIEQALRDVSGITSVGIGDSVGVGGGTAPYSGFATDSGVEGGRFQVSATYFDTLRTTFVAGRPFAAAEVRQRARLAIVSVTAAKALWPGDPPAAVVGRLLTLKDEQPLRVIGVMRDVKRTYGDDPYMRPALFVPFGLAPARFGEIVVRTVTGDPPDLGSIRRVVVDRVGPSRIAVGPVIPNYVSALSDPRFRAVLFLTLGLAGLLLSASGLYAVAALDVRQREHELGVRLSHGATSRDIQKLVIVHACRPVLAGLVAGAVAAYWATSFLQQFLYQVEPREPRIYALVAGIMIATAVVATWLPAWRAGRLDPAVVLRAQ